MTKKERIPEEFRALFRKWGASGGKAASKRMTPEERQARAAKGGQAAKAKRELLQAKADELDRLQAAGQVDISSRMR